MPVQYELHKNYLTTDPKDYSARVIPVGSASLDDVVDRIIDKGSTVVKSDIFSVLEDYYGAIEGLVLQGFNVNTPLCSYRVSLKGIFNEYADVYDPARHLINGDVRPGARFRDTVNKNADMVKIETEKVEPNPAAFLDIHSGEMNSILTASNLGHLRGHRLKYNEENESEGIFFIAADGTEHRVTHIAKTNPVN